MVLAQENGNAQIRKADNTTTLGQGASWFGVSAPTATDIAQWDNLVTGANSSDLGTDLVWDGIRVLNPGGAITIAGANTLTVGASGIDLSKATQNLTINSNFVLGGAQTWSVTAGRVLNIAPPTAISDGSGPVAIKGPGQVKYILPTLATPGVFGSTFPSDISVSGGTGLNNLSATGASPNSANVNLLLDFSALDSINAATLNVPTLTTGGGNVHVLGNLGTVAGSKAQTLSVTTLAVAAGQTNFTFESGLAVKPIYQFKTATRAAGGTVTYRDNISDAGGNASSNGGYRMDLVANVNGIVPYATYTKTSTSTSWFVAQGITKNGTLLPESDFTLSTADSLGTGTQNSTVVTDTLLSGTPAAVNSIRFNDFEAPRTVTIDNGNTLTVGAGAILVTDYSTPSTPITVNHTITGGTLMGGNAGSGSDNDLIVFQNNTTTTFIINSVIADNVTPTAFTKSGAGTVVLGGTNTYTGNTYVNAGKLLVNGSTNAASATTVNRGGTLGGTGAVNGAISLETGGQINPGVSGIGSLGGVTLTWNSDNLAAGMFFDLSSVNNSSDLLNLSGALTKGSGTKFVWDLQGGMVGQTYTLAHYGSTNFVAGDFGLAPGYAGTFTVGANTLTVQLTSAVPEPGTFALLIGGLGALALFRRRMAPPRS